MEFYALDFPSSEAKTKLVLCDPDEHGESKYRKYVSSDGEDKNIRVVFGKRFLTFDSLKAALTSEKKQYVLKAPGHPSVLLQSVGMILTSKMFFKNGIELACVDGVYVVKAMSSIFFQPSQFNSNFEYNACISCFDIKSDQLDIESRAILAQPTLSFNGTLGNFPSTGSYRIILNQDDPFIEENNITMTPYEFQEYYINNSRVFISKPFENLGQALLSGKHPNLFGRTLTVLKISDEKKSVIKYDFSREYCGWSQIVFPFICFVRGLSQLEPPLISSRIVHLPQSSGYGKTRLCFELLKFENCGVYCVKRSAGRGHPETTPWMNQLFTAFHDTTSDDEAVLLCMTFIKEAFDKFKSFGNTVQSKKEFWNIFEGCSQFPAVTFDLSRDSKKITETSIKEIAESLVNALESVTVFPIIFDECHELLIHPPQANRISLYRALRRALIGLKRTKIVAIFLGTKSSLEDFILYSRRDPSTREEVDSFKNAIFIPPYIYTTGVDVMLNEPFVLSYEKIDEYKTILGETIFCSSIFREVSLRCGRALWLSYGTYELAFKIALIKLQTEDSLYELTCFILRTGSSVSPQDPLAHKLVLSGMATLIQVDLEGSRCLVEYVPEPILSNAARVVLSDFNLYKKAIKDYLKRLELGTFHDSGTAGELVGRIILLRAMDLALIKITTLTSDNPVSKKYTRIRTPKFLLGSHTNQVKFNSCLKEIRSSVNGASGSLHVSPNLSAANLVFHDTVSESEDDETTSRSDYPDKSILIPTLGLTTLRAFLLMLTGLPNEELARFGVSNSVLDGFVSVNQFIHMENPLRMNQVYLMHGFARSCGFILPPRATGADLLIPVLRTDNMMSCVVIQVKNYNVQSFPHSSAKITAKLSAASLNWLSFSSIGDFDAAPADDFVRIVFQLRERRPEVQVSSETLHSFERIGRSNKNALWLFGLDAFEESLFFNDSDLIKDLNVILSGQRDFLNGLDYPEIHLPTPVQSTELGARYSARCARVLGSFEGVIAQDSQLRQGFPLEIQKLRNELEKLALVDFGKEYQENFKFSTKSAPFTTITELSNAEKAARDAIWKRREAKYLGRIEKSNSIYSDKAITIQEQADKLMKLEAQHASQSTKAAVKSQLIKAENKYQQQQLTKATQTAAGTKRSASISSTTIRKSSRLKKPEISNI